MRNGLGLIPHLLIGGEGLLDIPSVMADVVDAVVTPKSARGHRTRLATKRTSGSRGSATVGSGRAPVQCASARGGKGKTGVSPASTGAGDASTPAIVPTRSADLTPAVGANLRRIRVKRGLSLERLAHASGVSRAMLCQIELSQSAPTINVLWKIARALNVPFSALITEQTPTRTKVLTAASAKVLRSSDGSFSSRALFPFDDPRTVEFYELRLAPRSTEKAEPHPPGTVENLVVTGGCLEMRVAEGRYLLATGDAIQFEADAAHEYRNPGDTETVVYLVMTYAEQVGG